jgi:hypothetical protein
MGGGSIAMIMPLDSLLNNVVKNSAVQPPFVTMKTKAKQINQSQPQFPGMIFKGDKTFKLTRSLGYLILPVNVK